MDDINKNIEKKVDLNNGMAKNENNLKEEFLSYINSIKNLLDKNLPQNERFLIKRINILLIKMTCLFDLILKDNESVLKYESMLRKNENIIRKLYKNIFFLKSNIDCQDNTITNFVLKEKEFEKLKEKTGAFYSNGKLIYNGRKDNEIMILRTENSNLKSFIENKEKDIKNKDNEINQLKEKLLLMNKNKNKKNNDNKRIKNKNNSLPNINDLKYSYSNININFNEITHLKNYHSMIKNGHKSSNGSKNKTIYIPPQLRNDLSLKEILSKKTINNLYYHKKLKNKKKYNCSDKINVLTNNDHYISVNKSNYNIFTNKKNDRMFSNTINAINKDSNRNISLGSFCEFKSPPNNNKSKKKILNLKAYIEKDKHKDKSQRCTEKIVHNIIHKLTNEDKKLPFYSNFVSPISKYPKNKLKKKKIILK